MPSSRFAVSKPAVESLSCRLSLKKLASVDARGHRRPHKLSMYALPGLAAAGRLSTPFKFLQTCFHRPARLSDSLRERVVGVRAKVFELRYHSVAGLKEYAEFAAFVHVDFDSALAAAVVNAPEPGKVNLRLTPGRQPVTRSASFASDSRTGRPQFAHSNRMSVCGMFGG